MKISSLVAITSLAPLRLNNMVMGRVMKGHKLGGLAKSYHVWVIKRGMVMPSHDWYELTKFTRT